MTPVAPLTHPTVRRVTFVAALALLIGVAMASPAHAVAVTQDGVIYEVTGNYAAATGCAGACPEILTIADSIEGRPVTTVDGFAFDSANNVTELRLGNSITTIGPYAFAGMTGLTGTLTIPNSVQTIGGAAFLDASGITGLTLSTSLRTIGNFAFAGTNSLTGTLTIPKNVTVIGNAAFRHATSLTGVVVGDSVEVVGAHAFSGATALGGARFRGEPPRFGFEAFANSGAAPFFRPAQSAGIWPDSVDGHQLFAYEPNG